MATSLFLPTGASLNCSDPQARRARSLLFRLFRSNARRILLTYGLFQLENILALAQPHVLGKAINGLFASSPVAAGLFVLQYLAHLVVGSLRRRSDARTYNAIYTQLATEMASTQRAAGVDVSYVAARTVLCRELVSFFERDLPVIFQSLYSIIGGLLFLSWYDGRLAPLCLALVAPAAFLNMLYCRRTRAMNANLHDRMEREHDVIRSGHPEDIRLHYSALARCRISLSDQESLNFGLQELFVLSLLVGAIFRACHTFHSDAGHVFAIIRYILMFVTGLDSVPMLTQQFMRLKDILRRTCGEQTGA
jgi:ABC-type multidrug transport system fused ATPase/permease subunit